MNQQVKDVILVFLFFCAALIVRIFLLKYKQCIEVDGVAYVNIARGMVEQHSFTDHLYPPLYPLFIAVVSLIVSNYELAARLVSVACGSLLVFPVFALARELYGSRVAGFAAALVAFYPVLVDHSTTALSESTYLLLLFIFFLTLFHAFRRHQWQLFLVSGVLVGLAYLVRPEAIAYFYFALLCYVSLGVCKYWPASKSKLLVNSACLVVAALSLILPFMIYSGGVSGKTGTVLAFADVVGRSDFCRGIDEAMEKNDSERASSLAGEVMRHPVKMVKRCAMNIHLVHKYVLPQLFPVMIIAFFVLGLTRVKARYEDAFLLLSVVPLSAFLLLFVDARFFLPMVPVALVLAASGAEFLVDKLSGLTRMEFRWISSAVIQMTAICSLLPFTFRPMYRPDENATYCEAGAWLKKNSAQPIKVMERTPFVSFYSGAVRLNVPIGDWVAVSRSAVRAGATHIVIDDRSIPDVRKELAFLQFPDNAPTDLKLVHEFSAPDSVRVLLYQFSKRD